MMLTAAGLLLGLAGLYFGGKWLVDSASRLARSLGIPALIVGLTIVSIGTSTPELLVSTSAALRGSADIAIGNVVGSNIANIGLILGVSGLIYPISVHVALVRREIPLMLVVAALAYVLMIDGQVSRFDGLLLLVGMVGFIVLMIVLSRREQPNEPAGHTKAENTMESVNRLKEILLLLVGIGILMGGAQLTVNNAVAIARTIGVSELVIGVTLVAVGTSLPELVTSVMAALRQESDIAIGNVVGSNIFNLLGILGATAAIQPIQVMAQITRFDALVMIGFSVLALPFVTDRQLGRVESALFIAAYIAYVAYSISVGM